MKARFFHAAQKASTFSDFKKAQLGCVVVYKNKIISSGCNLEKTHPVQAKYNRYRGIKESVAISTHAEIKAISLIMNQDLDWKNISVYTYREHKDGSLALSRPCNSCMQLLKNLGIKHIYYTTDLGYAHEEIICSTVGKSYVAASA